jgi:hypothetical protein
LTFVQASAQQVKEARVARKTAIITEDDLDGGPADETVRFGFGGVDYEIDLNSTNARSLRERLAPFVDHARRSRVRPRRPSRTASARQRGRAIREWARDHGIEVSQRGRLPASVIEQYQSAAEKG